MLAHIQRSLSSATSQITSLLPSFPLEGKVAKVACSALAVAGLSLWYATNQAMAAVTRACGSLSDIGAAELGEKPTPNTARSSEQRKPVTELPIRRRSDSPRPIVETKTRQAVFPLVSPIIRLKTPEEQMKETFESLTVWNSAGT